MAAGPEEEGGEAEEKGEEGQRGEEDAEGAGHGGRSYQRGWMVARGRGGAAKAGPIGQASEESGGNVLVLSLVLLFLLLKA